ncbi:hypothetical protein HRED_08291, partial [Candidatus Haloredivivus sp. G17]
MNLKKYLSFTRVGLREGFQYRANALSGIGATLISLTLFYFIWKAIAASGELAQPFSTIIAYDKVLGKGHLNHEIKIHAEKFSSSAERKIEEAGGEV